jgi:hypothetical protein
LGTRAEVFATEHQAVEVSFQTLKCTPTDQFLATYFDPDGDFYEEIKDFFDTYSAISIPSN